MLYYLMGKSSSGKDTIYKKLMSAKNLNVKALVPYTTRPIREGEEEGREYHFTDKSGLDELRSQGKVIEERCYHTVHGDWFYFTVASDETDIDNEDYLYIGTLESYEKTRAYYGKEKVVPIYIELDDGERLERALSRERMQDQPKYKELCRRFIADCEDFSEEKLERLGIDKRFYNDDLDKCVDEICDFLLAK